MVLTVWDISVIKPIYYLYISPKATSENFSYQFIAGFTFASTGRCPIDYRIALLPGFTFRAALGIVKDVIICYY
jgi:hypothetical protein